MEETKSIGDLGIFQTRKVVESEEGEEEEKGKRKIESTLAPSTLERRKREIVIPIRPTGETYRRGQMESSLSLSSLSSPVTTPSEKKAFVVPRVEVSRDFLPPPGAAHTIVMRKKKAEDCTATTTIAAPPTRTKQTACRTVLVSPRCSASASLSVPAATMDTEDEDKKGGEGETSQGEEKADRTQPQIEQIEKVQKQQGGHSPPHLLPPPLLLPPPSLSLLPSSLPPKTHDKDKDTKMKTPKLAARVREGIADFTAGSSDRLQRWKNKLQTSSRRGREKDSSAPPPLSRCLHSSSPEVLMEWSVKPRPLHVTRSASNAITLGSIPSTLSMEHRTLRQDVPVYHNLHRPLPSSHYDHLPPRLVPFSSRPSEAGGIIRPVAFRPLAVNGDSPLPPTHKIEHTKSALNLSTAAMVPRSRGVFPSTSSSLSSSGLRQDNDYDTVADITREKERSCEGASSDFCNFSASSGSNGGSMGNGKKASSWQSTGVHITPSPSDSGIVDYETIIRDKENELMHVRKTMEQNEEIIVKVYLEKERNWKEQMDIIKAKLAASEKGEAALRLQMTSLTRQSDALATRVTAVEEEKRLLQAKVREMEWRECEACRALSSPSKGVEGSLRDEVSNLRREVATLREVVHDQRRPLYSTKGVASPRDRLI